MFCGRFAGGGGEGSRSIFNIGTLLFSIITLKKKKEEESGGLLFSSRNRKEGESNYLENCIRLRKKQDASDRRANKWSSVGRLDDIEWCVDGHTHTPLSLEVSENAFVDLGIYKFQGIVF